MNDRGERRFLWSLALVVAVGLCLFSLGGAGRLALLPFGLAGAGWAAYRIRRLSRRRPRGRSSN